MQIFAELNVSVAHVFSMKNIDPGSSKSRWSFVVPAI
jgi:hypothetical protein